MSQPFFSLLEGLIVNIEYESVAANLGFSERNLLIIVCHCTEAVEYVFSYSLVRCVFGNQGEEHLCLFIQYPFENDIRAALVSGIDFVGSFADRVFIA